MLISSYKPEIIISRVCAGGVYKEKHNFATGKSYKYDHKAQDS